MKENPSMLYRLMVGVMMLSLLSVMVYTDRRYREQHVVDLEVVSADAATRGPSSEVSKEKDPVMTAADDAAVQRASGQRSVRANLDALRLLAAFEDASVVNMREQLQGDGSMIRTEQLLTDLKYPLITREIHFEKDEQTQDWVAVGGSAWVSDQLLVGLKEGQDLQALRDLLAEADAELVQTIRDGNHFLIRFRAGEPDDLEDAASRLRLHVALAYVEPNFFRLATALPNDPQLHRQWALNNLGSGSGVFDVDINAPEAWQITMGDANVVVAVIDSGVQVDHPDLVGRIYVNLRETLDGKDNDGNGLIDDVNGWNFFDADQGSSDVSDTKDSHGTHVAGIIAATANNGIGGSGVSPGVTILPVKIFNEDGGFSSDFIRGMDYARKMGASIINASLGGTDRSTAEVAMIDLLQHHGILMVTSSGNSGENSDVVNSFPGAYPHANILNVGASNWFDEMEDYSTWGPTSVDVIAPGSGIFSTISPNGYEVYSGTSMATPVVAGVAALVKSVRTDWDAHMIKDAILSTVKPIDSASGKTVSGGRVDAHAAVLKALENTFFPNGLHIRIRSHANGRYVNPSREPHARLIADGLEGARQQTFEVVEMGASTYALKSMFNEKYVSFEAGGLEPLSATRDEISDWELFYPVKLGGGNFAFRCKANGLLVSAENSGNSPLIANRDRVGDWEMFEIEPLHLLPVGKQIALQSTPSARYVSLSPDGVLIPFETQPGDSNWFEVGLSLDGFVTLRSLANGRYVSAKTEGTLPLRATATRVGEWEKFVGIAHSKGILALRCKANGAFVASENEGTGPLIANRSEMGGWELFRILVRDP